MTSWGLLKSYFLIHVLPTSSNWNAVCLISVSYPAYTSHQQNDIQCQQGAPNTTALQITIKRIQPWCELVIATHKQYSRFGGTIFYLPGRRFHWDKRERIIASRINNCREFVSKKVEIAKGFPGIRAFLLFRCSKGHRVPHRAPEKYISPAVEKICFSTWWSIAVFLELLWILGEKHGSCSNIWQL